MLDLSCHSDIQAELSQRWCLKRFLRGESRTRDTVQELRACSVFRIMGLEVVWIVARVFAGKTGECGLSQVKGRKCLKKEGGTNGVKGH